MNGLHQLIDLLVLGAKADGRRLVRRAMEEIDKQLEFSRRSRGQKRRFERQRNGGKK